VADGYVDAGKLEVEVVADTRGLAKEIKAKAEAAAKSARPTVEVQYDDKAARKRLKEALPDDVKVKVEADVDEKSMLKAETAQRKLRDALNSTEKASLNLESAQTKLAKSERAGASDSIAHRRALLAVAEAQGKHADAITDTHRAIDALRKAANGTITADADTAAAEAKLKLLTRPRKVNIQAEADTGGAGPEAAGKAAGRGSIGLRKFGRALSRVATPILWTGITVLAYGLVGALGAVTAAISPVVYNLGLLPAVGAFAVAAIAPLLIGFEGIGAALKAVGQGDMKKLTKAMKGLSPAARKFVFQMALLKPLLSDVRKEVQNSLLDGMDKSLKNLSAYIKPGGVIRTGLNEAAKSWNAAFKQTSTFLMTRQSIAKMGAGMQEINAAGRLMSQTMRPLTSIFLSLFVGGAPFVRRMAQGILGMTNSLATFLINAEKSGKLTQFFERGFTVAKQLGRTIRDLSVGLVQFFSVGSGTGQDFLDNLEGIAAKFRAWTATENGRAEILRFFKDAAIIAEGMGTSISLTADVTATLLDWFHALPDGIKSAIGPLALFVGLFGKIAGGAIVTVAAFGMNKAGDKMGAAAVAMNIAANKMAGAAAAEGLGIPGVDGKGKAGKAGKAGKTAASTASGGLLATSLKAVLPVVVAAVAAYALIRPDKGDKPGPVTKSERQHYGSGGPNASGVGLPSDTDLDSLFGGDKKKGGGSTADSLKKQIDSAKKILNDPALKTILTKPRIMELRANITDWQSKLAVVKSQQTVQDKKVTVARLKADIAGLQKPIADAQTLLKDPKLTEPEKIKIRADLVELIKQKATAEAMLKIKADEVVLSAKVKPLEEGIEHAKQLLKDPNLTEPEKIKIRANIANAEQELARVRYLLANPSLVNPAAIKLRGDIANLQFKIEDAKTRLRQPGLTLPQKTAIRAEISNLTANVEAAKKKLSTIKPVNTSVRVDTSSIDAAIRKARDLKSMMNGGVPKSSEGSLNPNKSNMKRPGNQAARGGLIRGPGTSTSDSIVTALSDKEYVLQASAVRRWGVGFLNWMNGGDGGRGGGMGKAAGGLVTRANAAFTAAGPAISVVRAGAGQVGAMIAAGLAQGMAAGRGGVMAVAGALAASVPARMNAELGIASPSKVTATMGRWVVSGLVQGLTGSAATLRTAAARMTGYLRTALGGRAGGINAVLTRDVGRINKLMVSRDAVVKKLAAAQGTLNGLLTAAAKVKDDIAAKVRESFQLFGGTGASEGVEGITQRLSRALATAQQFAADVAKLKARGLAKGLMEQLAEAGPTAGAAMAKLLAGSTDAQLAQLNTLAGQLGTVADQTGATVADALYGAGIKAAQGLVAGLTSQQKQIEAVMLAIAKGMQTAIKRALGIRSPSRVMAQVGSWTVQGLEEGLMGRIGPLRAAVMAVADTMSATAGVIPVSASMAGVQTRGAGYGSQPAPPSTGGGDRPLVVVKPRANQSEHEIGVIAAREVVWAVTPS
jgi:hypothetical protein